MRSPLALRSPSTRHVAGRLLAGSSYEFESAVTQRLGGHRPPDTKHTCGVAIEAAVVLVLEVAAAGTEWHIHRGIEAMHHIDWSYRRSEILAAGPQEATA